MVRRILSLLAAGLALTAQNATAQQRVVVDASAPSALAVTVYRDPSRKAGEAMDRNWPQGFAMISETRQVTLPPGESTIRFAGVAEGMVAVSAIVTGLPGGTIERNRNAELLSPAALVDGTLGNRVRVIRTNPATGEEVAESAVIRTRADGGLVLQTGTGFEAVRCAGVPERLSFDSVPAGLSGQPVFSIDTRDEAGGTYTVTLTYLAWGFDWQANYVAIFQEGGSNRDVRLRLTSWLTILNDNGQSFGNADLMVVAGTLNVVSDFEHLSDPPEVRPLQLTCYPLGNTAAGSPAPFHGGGGWEEVPLSSPPMPAPMMMRMEAVADTLFGASVARLAQEEALGELKLYRVPEPVTVAAQGLKQVAFLDRGAVRGRYVYRTACQPYQESDSVRATQIVFSTVNTRANGLGLALPSGQVAIFEASSVGDLLVGQNALRDYAEGQDVELVLGESSQVMARCERLTGHDPGDGKGAWTRMRARFTNANPHPVTVRLQQGRPSDWTYRAGEARVYDGERITELIIPANGTRSVEWDMRPVSAQ